MDDTTIPKMFAKALPVLSDDPEFNASLNAIIELAVDATLADQHVYFRIDDVSAEIFEGASFTDLEIETALKHVQNMAQLIQCEKLKRQNT